MQFVVLANPENRRCRLFGEAALAAGLPAPRVVAWRDYLASPSALERALCPGAVVRVESPGEDAEVERALLVRGAEVDDPETRAERLSAAQVAALADTPGRIRAPRQWYLGFAAALRELSAQLEGQAVLNNPAAIEALFDKATSQRRLQAAGVPVPELLEATPQRFAELEATLAAQGWTRVFVKLRHSSSASGVVALSLHKGRCVATTSAELVRGPQGIELYNSLRVRRYTAREDVEALLDVLLAEGAHVERWVPKASQGGPFDLRIVVIGGVAEQAVVRVGRTTLTNLHLGNARGDLGKLRARLGDDGWARVRAVAEQAAAVYPDALYVGADVALSQSLKRSVVLELNAFGDLLPGVLVDGRDTYAAEVAAAVARFG